MAISTASSDMLELAANRQTSTEERVGLRIAVGIATTGRRSILSEMLRELSCQTRLPDRVVICPASNGDVDLQILPTLAYPTTIVVGQRGLTHQRNAILRTVQGYDVLVFFDDDFFPQAEYLDKVESLLSSRSDIVLATGNVVEDGVHGPGLTPAYARKLLAAVKRPTQANVMACYGAYGCNMIIRTQPALEHRLTFDEMLPLYAWQEDTDFSRQLAPHGEIIRSDALLGVHLGVKSGRTSGLKFGYSQIANPVYLMRKGTLSLPRGSKLMAKNMIANAIRSFRSEPHVDRLGRLKGNMKALHDLLRGRLHPMEILALE